MSVKQRIKEYIDKKNISYRAFSLSLGMSENYISSMKKSVQPDVLNKISVQYPDLNITWLLTGEGQMLKDPDNKGGPEQENFKDNQIRYLTELVKSKDKIITMLEDKLEEYKRKDADDLGEKRKAGS